MRFWLCILAALIGTGAAVANGSLADPIAAVRRVGPDGQGAAAAAVAWRVLAYADIKDLPTLLAGMDGTNALARNWLRSAIDRVLEQATAAQKPLPTADLDAFLRDTRHDPLARRLAYDLLHDADATVEDRYLPGMLDDPSPDLRRDAVARLLGRADKLTASEKKAEALPLYREALAAARDIAQIDAIARKLRDQGEKVDLPARLGLLVTWKLLGPFSNKERKGMDTAYPPEKALDFAAEYEGKSGKVKWQDYTSKDEHGIVDLKEALKDHTEVVTYATAEFVSPVARAVDVRLGCFTGFKLWLNGELVLERGDAYTGMQLDHYAARVKLRPGKNTILLKVAQDAAPPQLPPMLRFQLRVCDAGGAPVLPVK
jgi:hypothetical protein